MPKPNHVIERETAEAVSISEREVSCLENKIDITKRVTTHHEDEVVAARSRQCGFEGELEIARKRLKKEKRALKRVKVDPFA